MKVCDVLSEVRPDYEEREQALRDLASVLHMPEGFRVCLNLLRSLGLGRQLACTPEDVSRYNFGVNLLQDAASASPGAALNLMRALCAGLAMPLEGEELD